MKPEREGAAAGGSGGGGDGGEAKAEVSSRVGSSLAQGDGGGGNECVHQRCLQRECGAVRCDARLMENTSNLH